MKTSVSIGITAYNEDRNIGKLLTALLNQITDKIDIGEILVVSSGSTDNTDRIVEEFSKKESRIKLIKQDHREGKASAINEFIRTATNNILVLESADNIPKRKTIEQLCLPFLEAKTGMTGAHAMPVNNEKTMMGYVDHLLWELHHQISLKSPKCGELIAFRRVFDNMPHEVVVDEAWIECEIRKKGYEIEYVSSAILYNKGPETIVDFLNQRRRITCGHLELKEKNNYTVSSAMAFPLLSAISKTFPYRSPKGWSLFMTAVILESLGRILGYYDYYVVHKNHSVWKMAKTTKDLNANAVITT